MKSSSSIVLVHGLFGSQNDPKILEAFKGHQVLSPDMLGYGRYRDHPTEKLTLMDQANHVAAFLTENRLDKVHLVGHSVGGAIAALVALHHQKMLASLTTVEGNLTLKDAFWSEELSKKSDAEVAEIIAGYLQNPAKWFENSGVPSSDWSDKLAFNWLENQPPSTIKAQAAAVVAATREPSYLDGIKDLMKSGFPVNLVAGERASEGWDTPAWANQYCNMRINIKNVGHLMMAENPVSYARAVLACVFHSQQV